MSLGPPLFFPVFTAVVFIAVLSLGVSVHLTKLPDSPAVRSLNERVQTVFTLACGAIIGLLGGKTLS